MKKIRLLLLALSLLPITAFAGWYGGVGAGQSQADVDCDLDITCSADDTDTAIKLFAGNQITQNLGVEFGYVDLGEMKINGSDSFLGTANASIEATGFFAAVTGSMPLGGVSLFGKLGLLRWDIDANVNTSIGSGSVSESGTDPFLGVGAQIPLGQNLAIRAEWERFMDIGDTDTTGQSDVDVISVGLMFKF